MEKSKMPPLQIILYELLKEIIKQEGEEEADSKEKSRAIEKKRILKRWNKSSGKYYLNPDKYKYGMKDLK